MENHNPEEEDESKERLRKVLGVDPDKLMDSIRTYMELRNKYFSLELPLRKGLTEKMKELFEMQYPEIKPYIQIWHVNWVMEAMELVAVSLSKELINFFEKVKKGEDYKEGFKDYDHFVKMYSKPYEAHKTVIEYDKLQLNAEELGIYEQVVEESYQEDLIGCKQMNLERNEFLNIVYMQALRYFGEQTDTLTPEQWLHYDIIAGMGYEDYFDDCKELNYYLIKKNMQEYPGLDYHTFLYEESKKFHEEFTQWSQSVGK